MEFITPAESVATLAALQQSLVYVNLDKLCKAFLQVMADRVKAIGHGGKLWVKLVSKVDKSGDASDIAPISPVAPAGQSYLRMLVYDSTTHITPVE